MNLLDDLNEAQRKAVEYIDGPSLVIAGAGSGKTRVLTYKIAYLVQRNEDLHSLLVLTFTNKAAREMIKRFSALLGDDFVGRQPYIGTFHSVFARILHCGNAEKLGIKNYDSNFTIYDEADSRSLIKAIVKGLQLDERTYKPALVHSIISKAKNNLQNSAKFWEAHSGDSNNFQGLNYKSLYSIYAEYEQRCRLANVMDFDDLLYYTYVLFANKENGVCQKYASLFKYIMVDEYQDTNRLQKKILSLIYEEMPKKRICAVGDDAQSIYAFRGAEVNNILNFCDEFKNTNGQKAKLFKLEQNYRSTQTIVEAANSLIKHNRNQIPKDVYSKNAKGEKIQYKPAYSDKEEAVIVAKDIKRIKRQEDCEYQNFAILYRTNAQSRSFEEEFRKQGIPYRIYGGLSFYQRKEIKDIIAYFRVVANPDDEEAIKRIINYPARGIGATTIMKLADCAHQNHVSFWEVIGNPVHYGLSVNKGTLTKLDNFRLLISSFIERSHTTDVYELGDAIIKESKISEDIMSGKNADDLARQENLEELLSGMSVFVEERREEGRMDEAFLTDYLQDVALLTDADSDGEKDEPRVSLMTVHAAKGLEFPTVFVVGLEENIFPSPIAAVSPRELEEERRLLYVAITRAERHCILTNAKNRWRYGKMEFDNPSRFIDEIDANLLDSQEEMGGSIFGGGYGSKRNDDFGGGYGRSETGYGKRETGYGGRMPWDRNSVSSQFKADPKPSYTSSASSASSASRPASSVSRPASSVSRPTSSVSSPVSSASESPRSSFKSVRALNAVQRIMGTSSAGGSSSVSSSAASGLKEGARIEHQRFGIGTVLKIEGAGENAKATVEFQNSGTKQLLLKFAKFTILGH